MIGFIHRRCQCHSELLHVEIVVFHEQRCGTGDCKSPIRKEEIDS
jgi:hypothetical protein